MADMSERIAQLEKLVKRLIIVVMINLAAITFFSLLFLRPVTFEVLRVRRLEIVGQNGKAVIVLSTNPFGQPVIIVHDLEGRRRFGVSLDEQGNAEVVIFDADGKIVDKMGR